MTILGRKLIEVALPLEAINKAAIREKSIRHGHPSTLHLWWARRPLSVARAVIFAQMVDDPTCYVETLLGNPIARAAATREFKKRLDLWQKRAAAFEAATGKETVNVLEAGPRPTLEGTAADLERERLFRIIDDLVQWENTNNQEILERARSEIWQSWRRTCVANIDDPQAKKLFNRAQLPEFHDPFSGGGSLPLEAQRLGLVAYASDLNPVAVVISKAMIEIPPKFADKPPVNSEARSKRELISHQWKGAQGLADDVRYYGRWVREEALRRVGQFYPKIPITAEMVAARPDLKPLAGRSLTVIAWLWARTVKSPNPAFSSVDVPLASTFMLSTKPGREAYVEPAIQGNGYSFNVKLGRPANIESIQAGTKAGRGSNFLCLMSGSPISGDYIKAEGNAGRMKVRLMAIVAEGDRGRVYLSPDDFQESVALGADCDWRPSGNVPARLTGGTCVPYGLKEWGDLFTSREIVALSTLSDLVLEARNQVLADAEAAEVSDDAISLDKGGVAATAYADAIAVYLGLAVSRTTNTVNALAVWSQSREQSVNLFSRQAIPMAWDFPEVNPFAGAAGDFGATTLSISKTIANASNLTAHISQADAQRQRLSINRVVSTDPPYYDNVGYADLSDFFYVWLRHSLRKIVPSLFATVAVPKDEELVATAYRHGGKQNAEKFFLDGMSEAMRQLAEQSHPGFPVTIYYAFKQSESQGSDGVASTGWETFLDAVIKAGFAISGTWPMRTERPSGVKTGTNALASSIILVCRPRLPGSATATRREFLNALKAELPAALTNLQRSNIAPVDLAQASIGPGMAVYTRYAKVVDAEGNVLSVREALAIINQILDEVLSEQEGEFDPDSRWAVAWFDQVGFAEGVFGMADVLARAKVTAVAGLVDAGIIASRGGKVRLLKPAELPGNWDPTVDPRLSVWEMVHHLIRVLESEGEAAAALLLAKLGVNGDSARELAYRLYSICERRKRAADALSYNALVQSWPEISRLSQAEPSPTGPTGQADLFGGA